MDITNSDEIAGHFVTHEGKRLLIRAIRPSDAPLLQDLHRRHSPETRRMRFFSAMPELDDDRALRFASVDFRERAAFVATSEEGNRVHAVARYEAASEGTAEVAFVMEDELQGQGLGSVLFRLLASYARAHGYTTLKATTLAENRAMLRVFEKNAIILDVQRDGPTLEIFMQAKAA